MRWIDHRTGQEHEQHAPTLVLAAGTLGTLRLLYQARDRDRTLPGLPAALGRHFYPNGDVFSLLWRTARLAGSGQPGPSVIAAGRAFPGGRYRFFVAEGGMSLQAGLPGRLRAALASSTLLICTGRDRVDGRVTFDGRGLRTEVSRYDDPALFDDIDRAVDALATSYRPSRRFTGLPGMAPNTLLTVHPLGGASLSTHPTDGVTDRAGQVHGHPGLYVADGSLYPVAPGFPPALTITALSERIAELITHEQP